jgi:L-ascorbate metabolism protein UlaG (beta-lactamase superfamily)
MKQLGRVGAALLPTGDKYTMDNTEATIVINPKFAVPTHRWDTDSQQFEEKVEAKSKIKAVLLKDGEEFNIT